MAKCCLPQDMVIEILTRLPVKSLIRFRCVCKYWNAFTRNPVFITMHINQVSSNDHNVHLLVKHCDEIQGRSFFSLFPNGSLDVPAINLNLDFEIPEYIKVMGPCNGIFLLFENESLSHELNFLGLWNPSTREFRELPTSPLGVAPADKIRWVEVGFGLDSETGDYKVVKISTFNTRATRDTRAALPRAEVYTLSTDSWRVMDDNVPTFVCQDPLFTFTNGCFRWEGYDYNGDRFIVSFDMRTENFRVTSMPKRYYNMRGYVLGTYSESFAMIYYPSYPPEKMSFDVWVMNKYGVEADDDKSSWTHKLTIGPIPPDDVRNLLGFWKNGELLIENLTRQLLLYDPTTKKFKKLQTQIQGIPLNLQALSYRETLVSVKRPVL